MEKQELTKILHSIIQVINKEFGKKTQEFNYSDCEYIFNIKENDPRVIHKEWLENKKAQGWVYGALKDFDKKTHPCIVPYEELKIEDKVKDLIVLGIKKYYDSKGNFING